MENKEINIVYCLNNIDYMSVLVSVQSVIKNNSNNFINFYFIVDETFEQDLIKTFNFFIKLNYYERNEENYGRILGYI